jgi:oxygen-independent coproporphyrinogen-3 oxidase
MFGTPDDNTQSWEIDLKLALEHKPVHISAYCLSLSEGCRFFSDYQTGLIRLPNEEQQRVLFSLASSVLTDAGYEHYEISNYAKENKRSRHNQAYWQGIDYLGLGAGAHSYLGRKARQLNQRVQNYGIRWSNKSNPKEYVHSVRQLRSKYEMIERINQAQAKTEFMMLRLRQADGFGVKEYESEFQSKLPKKVVSSIENFCRQGLAKTEKSRISLTPQGFLLADEIVRELVAELD